MSMLTMQNILRRSRKFIKNGKLGAQHNSFCEYGYPDGSRCIIGCGLTNKMDLAYHGVITTLVLDHEITVDKRELTDMKDLQLAHDHWAISKVMGSRWTVKENRYIPTKELRSRFYKLMRKMRKKYE